MNRIDRVLNLLERGVAAYEDYVSATRARYAELSLNDERSIVAQEIHAKNAGVVRVEHPITQHVTHEHNPPRVDLDMGEFTRAFASLKEQVATVKAAMGVPSEREDKP